MTPCNCLLVGWPVGWLAGQLIGYLVGKAGGELVGRFGRKMDGKLFFCHVVNVVVVSMLLLLVQFTIKYDVDGNIVVFL